MSFDSFWRIPGPWEPARLRAAIERAATRFVGATIRIEERGDELAIVADWPAELVKRWACLREERDEGNGQMWLSPIRPDDDDDEWIIGSRPTVDSDDNPILVYALSVQAKIVSHGLRGVYGAGADGWIGSLNERGAVLTEPVEPPLREDLEVLAIRGAQRWAASNDGGLIRRAGREWIRHDAPEPIFELQLGPDDALWACGQRCWRFSDGAWTESSPSAAPGVHVPRSGHGPSRLNGGWVSGEWQPWAPAEISAVAWSPGMSRPWLFEYSTAYQPTETGWTKHELPDDIGCACIGPEGHPWVGSSFHGRWMGRWDGARFVEVPAGFTSGPSAIARFGDGVIAVGLTDDGPVLVDVTPSRYLSLHVASNIGGTRETWGVTTELASAIAIELGGVSVDT